MVSGEGKVWLRVWGIFLSIIVVYFPNLSLLMSLEPLKQFLCGGVASGYIMRSHKLYYEEPEIISWGARDYIMRSQRLYHEEPGIISWGARDYIVLKVILVFSLSLSQAEQLFPGLPPAPILSPSYHNDCNTLSKVKTYLVIRISWM